VATTVLIGLRLISDEARPLFYLGMVLITLAAVLALRRLALSGQGAALQALRDAPMRAAASGLAVSALKYRVFLQSAALAGLAGALFAAHKGAVFPSIAGVATSVDALLVVLLGGVHQLWGAVAGSALLHLAAQSPYATALQNSLAIAGVDGTVARLKDRQPNSVAIGRALLKSGSLRDVASLAGYVDGLSGKRYVFVVIVNHPNANATRLAFDRLLEWTVKDDKKS